MLQVKITKDLKSALKIKAKEKGLFLSSFIIIILEDYLKRNK